MSERTLEAPPLPPQAAPPDDAGAPAPAPWTLRGFARAHPWWTAAATVVAMSVVLLVWAGTRPSFDAYGWLVWGHQTLAGALDTNAAPSWKPLPYVFTVPYALFGHYELWLWMLTSVAISLGGALAAGRIAYRLTAAGGVASADRAWRDSRHLAGLVAAAIAAASLLGIQDWWHYVLSAQSDPMIVALCLGGVDAHLSRHPRWAFLLGVLASLGRPEVWPFLGVYSIWAWRAVPSMRWLVGVGITAIALLWFGVPALTARTPLVAASNAFGSGRRLRSDQVAGTLQRFLDLHQTSLEIAALLSLGWAAIRRERVVLTLSAAAVLWVAIEVAFALNGWPALGRYMFGAAGLMVVIAAVGAGRLLADGLHRLTTYSRSPRVSAAGGWLAVGLVAALVGSLIPAATSAARLERHDLHFQRDRTREIDRLQTIVTRLGGPARLQTCGEPVTLLEYQTVLAWMLERNVADVGFRFGKAIHHVNPAVLFTPLRQGGWRVRAVHQRGPACRL